MDNVPDVNPPKADSPGHGRLDGAITHLRLRAGDLAFVELDRAFQLADE